MNNNELYCKIYADSDTPREDLIQVVSASINGTRQLRTVESDSLEADILSNEDFDPTKRNEKDAFLFYRHYLDVFPKAGASREEFISSVRILISKLKSNGYKAVPACDFEQELDQA